MLDGNFNRGGSTILRAYHAIADLAGDAVGLEPMAMI